MLLLNVRKSRLVDVRKMRLFKLRNIYTSIGSLRFNFSVVQCSICRSRARYILRWGKKQRNYTFIRTSLLRDKVLSDQRLGAKLRVTENRCVLFDSFTYIYPALLPQHWALYAKVDSTPHLYIYLFIYLLHTYRDKRTKMHQDKNSLFVLEKPADWPRFFSLSSPVNKTVSLAHRSSWLTNSTFIRA